MNTERSEELADTTKEKISVGVVHGRFQPPHNGHIRYILAALGRAEHVLVGICTPEACTEAEAARTGYPGAPHLNPFTHAERAGMIAAALEEAGIARDRYSFIPFPSDYQGLGELLPKNAVFLMSVTADSDKEKISYLERLGFKAETVYFILENGRHERSGLVRERGAEADPSWEDLVPPSIARYIREHGLLERLS